MFLWGFMVHKGMQASNGVSRLCRCTVYVSAYLCICVCLQKVFSIVQHVWHSHLSWCMHKFVCWWLRSACQCEVAQVLWENLKEVMLSMNSVTRCRTLGMLGKHLFITSCTIKPLSNYMQMYPHLYWSFTVYF